MAWRVKFRKNTSKTLGFFMVCMDVGGDDSKIIFNIWSCGKKAAWTNRRWSTRYNGMHWFLIRLLDMVSQQWRSRKNHNGVWLGVSHWGSNMWSYMILTHSSCHTSKIDKIRKVPDRDKVPSQRFWDFMKYQKSAHWPGTRRLTDTGCPRT